MSKDLAIKQYIDSDVVQSRIKKLLDDKAQQFITTVTTLSMDQNIAKCDPASVVGACLKAVALDLSVDQNLGEAYVIPYFDRKTGQTYAQLQFGYRAFIKLAISDPNTTRAKYIKIYESDTQESARERLNVLFEKEKPEGKVIGYLGYYARTNGFEQTLYMSVEELQEHAKKYSQTYKKGFGLWKDNFEAMASKTVLKLLLSKYAPLQTIGEAVVADQAVIREDQIIYPDNTPPSLEDISKEEEVNRLKKWVEESETLSRLEEANEGVYATGNDELIAKYEQRVVELGENIKA